MSCSECSTPAKKRDKKDRKLTLCVTEFPAQEFFGDYLKLAAGGSCGLIHTV